MNGSKPKTVPPASGAAGVLRISLLLLEFTPEGCDENSPTL
jgi:hypothetical protein